MLIKEVVDDSLIIREAITSGALKEYRFNGTNGPAIMIQGAGISGWTKDGARLFMKENDVEGVLTYWGMLTKVIDSYLDRLNAEVECYPHSTLVGYSAGGFIALGYVEKYGWDKIKNIVTIATPLMGSQKNLRLQAM